MAQFDLEEREGAERLSGCGDGCGWGCREQGRDESDGKDSQHWIGSFGVSI